MLVYKAEDFLKDGLKLHISEDTTDIAEQPHRHNFLEIVYILNGEALQKINSAEYSVKRGNLLFINYNSTHSFEPKPEFTYYNIMFEPETLSHDIINQENAFGLLSLTAFDEIYGKTDSTDGIVTFSENEQNEIEYIFSAMLYEYSNAMPAYKTVLQSYMNILIAKILRKMYQPSAKNAEPDMWSELLEYINSNIKSRLTLEALAKKCFYNPSYFSRVFKEKYSITLAEYIWRTRVTLAADMLKSTSLTTEDISKECGYSDKSALFRGFQKVYGCTPNEYRNRK